MSGAQETVVEDTAIDRAARKLASGSRRRVLCGLSLSPLAWLVATRTGDAAEAKRKRKRRKKTEKPKPKQGKPDKSRCVAHDATICRGPDTDTCTTGVAHHCSGQNVSCGCLLTTGNGGFCGGPGSACRVCSRDADCQEEFGAGAACVVFGGICELNCLDDVLRSLTQSRRSLIGGALAGAAGGLGLAPGSEAKRKRKHKRK